jgi:hypothetical protein
MVARFKKRHKAFFQALTNFDSSHLHFLRENLLMLR